MCIVHQPARHSPDALACAQQGCMECLNQLVCQHEGLVHAVLRHTHRCGAPYANLVHEGRIALWRAVCGFDAGRGVAFPTYAWVVIQRPIASSPRHRCLELHWKSGIIVFRETV